MENKQENMSVEEAIRWLKEAKDKVAEARKIVQEEKQKYHVKNLKKRIVNIYNNIYKEKKPYLEKSVDYINQVSVYLKKMGEEVAQVQKKEKENQVKETSKEQQTKEK